MGGPDAAAQPGAGWDEAQCTAALARLEELQAQIDNLRLAIPRIIEPFHRPPNPMTYKLYAQGVIGSQKGLEALKSQWMQHETQSVFEHVKKSFSADANLSESVTMPSHGWRERARKARESIKKTEGDSVEDIGATLTDEHLSQIIADFSQTHPNLKMEIRDDKRSILVRFLSGCVTLKFRIRIEREANGRHKLNAQCLGTTEPFLAITRCVASRPHTNDLKDLLDMIAAYKTVEGTSCAKCGKLLDNSAMTPTARRNKQIDSTGGAAKTTWEAFHEDCLE
ncbi:hypothetical protein BDW02DRAFT_157558 [Decorospora gaudefroyi]|uniref:Uncharacterized protein n=1 Tax=Decorospora gaudefroyi TaxID=184978 RepID=A0A6A5KN50_9PLEO|nr:hypothetical protein BDW02DRAFT_157558 [Decorospora gaudefroyi]